MVLYVGLSGTMFAGKGEVCRIIERRYGAYAFTLSDILRGEADQRGVHKTRQSLTDIADELRLTRGPGVLAEMALKHLATMKEKRDIVVIDSIRNPYEVETLRSSLKRHFILIFIDAPLEERYRRSIERKREGEGSKSFEEFVAKNEEEMRGRPDRLMEDKDDPHGGIIDYGVNLGATASGVNEIIINDTTVAELEKKVIDIIEGRIKLLTEYED